MEMGWGRGGAMVVWRFFDYERRWHLGDSSGDSHSLFQ